MSSFIFLLHPAVLKTSLGGNRMLNPEQNGTTRVSSSLARTIAWMASAVALVGFISVVLTLLTSVQLPGKDGVLEAVLLIALAVVVVASEWRRMPGQNVIVATLIIGVLGGIAHGVSAAIAIPFGPILFTDTGGPRLFHKLAWYMPFIWIVAVLSSRSVARMILRPWRKVRTSYGYWVIGLTAVLTVLLNMMLEPFGARIRHYWLWEPTRISFTWHGAPVTNILGWTMVSLLILALITPVLIRKRRSSRKSGPDYLPLGVWLLLDVLFAVGAGTQQLWSAVILCAATGAVVAAAAIRGSRW